MGLRTVMLLEVGRVPEAWRAESPAFATADGLTWGAAVTARDEGSRLSVSVPHGATASDVAAWLRDAAARIEAAGGVPLEGGREGEACLVGVNGEALHRSMRAASPAGHRRSRRASARRRKGRR